jgi:hypothetical protein
MGVNGKRRATTALAGDNAAKLPLVIFSFG